MKAWDVTILGQIIGTAEEKEDDKFNSAWFFSFKPSETFVGSLPAGFMYIDYHYGDIKVYAEDHEDEPAIFEGKILDLLRPKPKE